MRNLYDVLEDFGMLRLEIAYQMKAQKALIESELRGVYQEERELLDLIDGITSTHKGLLCRLDRMGEELSEIMRATPKDQQ